MSIVLQWWIQDFPEGAPTPETPLFGQIFSQKLHGNERNWPRGARVPAPLDPPIY